MLELSIMTKKEQDLETRATRHTEESNLSWITILFFRSTIHRRGGYGWSKSTPCIQGNNNSTDISSLGGCSQCNWQQSCMRKLANDGRNPAGTAHKRQMATTAQRQKYCWVTCFGYTEQLISFWNQSVHQFWSITGGNILCCYAIKSGRSSISRLFP